MGRGGKAPSKTCFLRTYFRPSCRVLKLNNWPDHGHAFAKALVASKRPADALGYEGRVRLFATERSEQLARLFLPRRYDAAKPPVLATSFRGICSISSVGQRPQALADYALSRTARCAIAAQASRRNDVQRNNFIWLRIRTACRSYTGCISKRREVSA